MTIYWPYVYIHQLSGMLYDCGSGLVGYLACPALYGMHYTEALDIGAGI